MNRSRRVEVLEGDARHVLTKVPSASVQCVVTSPPYFGLRDYHCSEQIGLERTVEEYLRALMDVFRQVGRILRSNGICWVNLGDTYNNYLVY